MKSKNVQIKLNDKQKNFCNEYLVDLNATKAAIRAGYSEKTAYSIGSENLRKPEIQEYIAELQEGIRKRTRISQDEIIQDLIEIKNRCMVRVPVMRFDKEEKKYIQVTDEQDRDVWKFDSQGASKALDQLAKIIGAYEKDNEQKAEQTSIVINREIVDIERD